MSLSEICCGQCGIVFGMPPRLLEDLRESKRTFYCPNGHGRAYVTSAKDKEIERLKREAEQRDREILSLRAETSRPWRCPHCTRRYVGRDGLLKHVSSVHGAREARLLAEKAGPDAHGDMGIRGTVVSIGRRGRRR